MSDNKLKSIFDRVNRLLDDRDAITSDVADIYLEAKKGGLVPKVIRKIVQRSRMDQTKLAAEDALQEMYEAALDAPTRQAMEMALKGATSREIETATGLDHATVARDMPVKGKAGRKAKLSHPETKKPDIISPPEVATLPVAPPPHDPETGEIEAEAAPVLPPQHAAAVGAVLDVLAAGDGDTLEIPPHLDRRQRASA